MEAKPMNYKEKILDLLNDLDQKEFRYIYIIVSDIHGNIC